MTDLAHIPNVGRPLRRATWQERAEDRVPDKWPGWFRLLFLFCAAVAGWLGLAWLAMRAL